jgi:hypothetical protein
MAIHRICKTVGIVHSNMIDPFMITKHAFASPLILFTQLRALLVLHDRGNTLIINIIINRAFAGPLNCFTQLIVFFLNMINNYSSQSPSSKTK